MAELWPKTYAQIMNIFEWNRHYSIFMLNCVIYVQKPLKMDKSAHISIRVFV